MIIGSKFGLPLDKLVIACWIISGVTFYGHALMSSLYFEIAFIQITSPIPYFHYIVEFLIFFYSLMIFL